VSDAESLLAIIVAGFSFSILPLILGILSANGIIIPTWVWVMSWIFWVPAAISFFFLLILYNLGLIVSVFE